MDEEIEFKQKIIEKAKELIKNEINNNINEKKENENDNKKENSNDEDDKNIELFKQKEYVKEILLEKDNLKNQNEK